jgi:hypothetical protein
MNIDDLIRLHNETLNRKVENKPFLNQRIKARLNQREHAGQPGAWFRLKKSILVYSFVFILFTVLNLMLIGGLKTQESPKPGPGTLAPVNMTAFQPAYPGSISRAYGEVMK